MTRGRGGFIGTNVVPAASGLNSAASGVWNLREAESLKRAGTWPIAFVNPTSISGLQLWLDAADASTLYDATTGGSLVAADGTVARWEDKSTNARHATQGTAGSRPTRKTAVQNGRDVLRFDGTADFMDVSSTISFQLFSCFVVCMRTSTSGTVGVYCADDGTAPNARGSQTVVISGNAPRSTSFSTTSAGSVTVTSTETITANTYFLCTAQQSSSTLSIRKNAVSGGSSAATHHSTARSSTVGRNLKDVNNNFLHNGDICEIVLYDTALSDANRTLVENYLIAKWGIT